MTGLAQDAGAEDGGGASESVSYCAALGDPAVCNGLDDTETCAEGFVCTDSGTGAFYCVGQGEPCDPAAPEECAVTSTCLTYTGECVDGACADADANCDAATNQCVVATMPAADMGDSTDEGDGGADADGRDMDTDADAGTAEEADGEGAGAEEGSSDDGGCSVASSGGPTSGAALLWLVALGGYLVRRRGTSCC